MPFPGFSGAKRGNLGVVGDRRAASRNSGQQRGGVAGQTSQGEYRARGQNHGGRRWRLLRRESFRRSSSGRLSGERNRSRIDRRTPSGNNVGGAKKATFCNGQFLGRPITTYDDAGLKGAIEAYNIGTIVAWSDTSKKRLSELSLSRVELEGGFTVFRTRLDKGFALGGSEVNASAESIVSTCVERLHLPRCFGTTITRVSSPSRLFVSAPY